MADTKISALNAITGANVNVTSDVLPIVNISSTATKKITVDEIGIAMGGVARAWVVFDGTNANPITKLAGYNISGTVTKNATGDYTIAFASSFASTNYAVVGGVAQPSLGNVGRTWGVSTQATGSCRVIVADSAGSGSDPAFVSLAFYGSRT